jgi:hypothetical protein
VDLYAADVATTKTYHHLDSVMIGDKGAAAATDMQELRKCESL